MHKLLTPDLISRMAAGLLYQMAISLRLMSRPMIAEEMTTNPNPGDKIKVRIQRPIRPQYKNGPMIESDITELEAKVVVLGRLYNKIKLEALVRTFQMNQAGDFDARLVVPLVAGWNEFIEEEVLRFVASQVPFFSGTPGSPAATRQAVKAVDTAMKKRKAIGPRWGAVDPDAEDAMFGIDGFVRADQRGDTSALADAEIGRVVNTNFYLTTGIPLHVPGSLQAGAPLVNGAVAAGVKGMAVDGGLGTETIEAGDLFTVSGVEGQYVFTERAQAVAGSIGNAAFYPEAPAGGFPDNAAVNILPQHTKNITFMDGAFATAIIPPPAAMGAPSGVFSDPTSPIGMRTTFETVDADDYVIADAYLVAGTVQPEMAQINLG